MRHVWVLGLYFLLNLLGGARLLDPSVVNIPGAGVGVQYKEYQIVYPKRIYKSGEEYPTERHFHKRSVGESWDKNADYSLDLPSGTVKFKLEHTDDFVLPDIFVQHISDNRTWLERPENKTEQSCYFQGTIDGATGSYVRLSLCDGMTGMFNVKGEHYLIEPYTVGDNNKSVALNQSEYGIPHLLYSFKNSHRHLNNGNDSTCGINAENYKHRRRKRVEEFTIEEQQSSDSSVFNNNSFIFYTNSTSSHHRHKRSVSFKNYVEVMVAADYKMLKYHGDNLQHYVLNLMSIEGPEVSSNAGESLKRFCKWQAINNEDENSRYHYDTAVLITRHDICRAPNKCDTLGLAELGTMCDPERSCSIIEDNGIGAAYTIAHELGHVFDLPHDNDQKCYRPYYVKDPEAQAKIMAPAIDRNTDPWSWSECSAKLIAKFLDTGAGKCLQDEPRVKKYNRHIKNAQRVQVGSMYSANKQCELFYGTGYMHCPYHFTCSALWCTTDKNLGCLSLYYPMIDGTKCGNGKWCYRGECVKAKLAKKIKGGWSKWSAYGKCTRTCSGGIKRAYRECNNPEPSGGGRYCTGKQVKYRHCNTKPCPSNSDDFRIQQCQEFNGQRMPYYYNIKGTDWVPKYDGFEKKDWCKLYCKDKRSPSHFYMLDHKVIDGTKCRPDSDDICINGECRLGGCDNKLGSRMKRDRCGVCGGDNASCKTISGNYNYVKYGYNNVTVIPAGATNIDVRQIGYENTDDKNYLAIMNQRKEYILNGDWTILPFPEKINVSGAILEYSGSKSFEERINSTGILLEQLQIQVLTIGELNYPNIKFSYTMSLKTKDIRFVWKEDTAWSECNNICNGMRYKNVKCIRETDGTQVSEQRCENQPTPYTERERCNPFCTVNWRIIRDECTAPCGSGIAKQYISCTLTTRHNTTEIDIDHCVKRQGEIGPRPQELVKCQGKCVESHWVFSDWTECTASCDGGAQKRSAECVDTKRGSKLDEHHCSKKDLMVERTCNLHHCPGWRAQDWTGCSVTCGHGSRHRKITCYQGDQVVIDTQCDYKKKPTSKLECYMGTCPRWITEDWGECSTTCEMGIAIRAIKCEASSGQFLDDFRCDATLRPYETKHCNQGPCPTTPISTSTAAPVQRTTPKTFVWTTGSWTQCSASCGEGIKQRYVTCLNNHGEAVDTFDCDQLTKPAETETCIQQACGYWRTGDWGKCSVTCGTGLETRFVACTKMDRTPANEVQCDIDAKPEMERPCSPGECQPEDFDIHVITANTVVGISHWRVGPWSACSATCGMGWQRRQVLCHDEKGPSDTCAEDQKPENRQTCDVGACPQWAKSEWSQCSKSCGGVGIQKRTVQCQSGDGQKLPDSSCDIFERPPESGMCNLGPCSKNRLWQVGPWSPCSVTCGTGHSQRIVLCVSEGGSPRSSTECEETKPRNTKRCTEHPCPTWSYTKWGKCSTTCGSGVQDRQVICRIGHSQIVPDQLCLAAKKPRPQKKCDMRTCSDYMWTAGNWSECSKQCGFGVKTRNITCTDAYGKLANESYCDSNKLPKWKRRCSEFPCPFMWNSSPWSECSSTCGEGLQRRRVVCQAVTREGWILPGEVPYGCKVAERLNETQTCNYGPCQARYHWVTAPWGECSTRCGHGVERRQVQCVDLSGRRQKKKLCSKEHRPKGRQPCYNGPCYASSCKQLKEQTSIRQEGSYKLFVKGRLIEIFCKDMKKSLPQEFLSLPAGESENFSHVYPYRLKRHRTCPNNGTIEEPCSSKLCRTRPYRNAGQTSYSKIKIDIVSLKIQASDLTYAKSSKGRNIPFGSAGDCFSSAECPQGQFSINLSGTGLLLSPNTTWESQGEKASHNITRLQDGEVVKGRCGGLCGWCLPVQGLQLDVLT